MAIVQRTQYLVEPGAGTVIWSGPIGTIIKIPSAATRGALSVSEMPIAAGYMVPPHTHHETDEWSYVLEGQVGARIDDDEFTAGPGSWILKPRGLMHTFWNAGPAPARIIELLTPGRFEEFFRHMTDLATRGELTDQQMGDLAVEFGTAVSMDWVDELSARYGLEVTI